MRWQNPSETSGQHGQHPAAGLPGLLGAPLQPPLRVAAGVHSTRAGTERAKQGDFLQQTVEGENDIWIISKVSLLAHFPVIISNTVERRRSSFGVSSMLVSHRESVILVTWLARWFLVPDF